MDLTNYKNELDSINSQQRGMPFLSEDTVLEVTNRTISIPPELTDIVVAGDTNSRKLTFKIHRFFDGVDLSEKIIRVKYMNVFMESGYGSASNLQLDTDTFSFDWIINSEAVTKQGTLSISIEFYQNNSLGKKIYVWQTKPAEFNIENSFFVTGNAYPADYSLHKKFYEANKEPVVYSEIIDTEAPISIAGRRILMPSISDLVVSKDALSQIISFTLPRFFEGVDLSKKVISIKYLNASGSGDRSRGVNTIATDDSITFGWLIDNKVTIIAGYVQFAIEFLGYNEKNEFYVWQTTPAQLMVERGLDVDSIIIAPTPSWIQSWELEVDKIYKDMQSQIDNAESSKEAAKESEENALASQIAAALSEANAKLSELNSKASEDEAKKQAVLSSECADKSKASETAAALSETNAKASETASDASALAAKASEEAAKLSEDNSKASELASKASEDISADNAEITNTNVSEASAFAQNAGKSASAAKTSEDNSKDSETNAEISATTASEKAALATTEANRAKSEADRASSIVGNLGWFETGLALNTTHPTAFNGAFATVGETDSIWVWDDDTSKWLDSQNKGSGDYNTTINKPQINGITLVGDQTLSDLGIASSAQGNKADSAIQSAIIEGVVVPVNGVQLQLPPYPKLNYATAQEAISGTENTKVMTSLRVKESVENTLIAVDAAVSALDTRVTANTAAIGNIHTAKADKTEIPTKTSQLTNDSEFAKASEISSVTFVRW